MVEGDRLRKERPSQREQRGQKSCGKRRQSTWEDLRKSENGWNRESAWNRSRLEKKAKIRFLLDLTFIMETNLVPILQMRAPSLNNIIQGHVTSKWLSRN